LRIVKQFAWASGHLWAATDEASGVIVPETLRRLRRDAREAAAALNLERPYRIERVLVMRYQDTEVPETRAEVNELMARNEAEQAPRWSSARGKRSAARGRK
jgi:hypothetical protein